MRQQFNVNQLSSSLTMDMHEIEAISGYMPQYMARAIADKFVEENWPKIKKDKAFMEMVKGEAAKQSALRVTDLLASKIETALEVSKS